MQKIAKLLQLDWEVKILHTYREANRCADALLAMGCSQIENYVLLSRMLATLGLTVLADVFLELLLLV